MSESALLEENRQIIREEIAEPLKLLRRQAGEPTYEQIAEKAGVSRNTVDNAFNARRLNSLDSLTAIVEALGGDPAQWEKRRAAALDRIERLKQPPPQESAAESTPAPNTRRGVRLARLSLALAGLGAVAILVTAVLLGRDAFTEPGSTGSLPTSPPARPAPAPVCDHYVVTAQTLALRTEAGAQTGDYLTTGAQVTVRRRTGPRGAKYWYVVSEDGRGGWVLPSRRWWRAAC